MQNLFATTIKIKEIYVSTLFRMQHDVTYYDLVALHLQKTFSVDKMNVIFSLCTTGYVLSLSAQ